YTSKKGLQLPAPDLPQGRQTDRRSMRSNDLAEVVLLGEGIPRASAPRPIPRPRKGEAAGFFDQQLRTASKDNRGPVSQPLARRAVLQVDQAAPAPQGVRRHPPPRAEDA